MESSNKNIPFIVKIWIIELLLKVAIRIFAIQRTSILNEPT